LSITFINAVHILSLVCFPTLADCYLLHRFAATISISIVAFNTTCHIMKQGSSRRFDLVVFGATGYTGKLTSEQVLQGTPSTLQWAIAGRSPQKLDLLAGEYNRLYMDRVPVRVLPIFFFVCLDC